MSGSSPNWQSGYVATAAEWNALWASKADAAGSSVKGYGAKGNGTTDDTAAIAEAANAIPSEGGVLLFPPGDYLISDAINLKTNTNVQGAGATITAAPAVHWPGGDISSALFGNSVNNVTIDGLTFIFPRGYQNYGPSAAAHIIGFNQCTNIRIRNCNGDGAGDFIAIVGCTDVLIEGCRATNFDNGAYDHWGGSKDCRVIGNYASSLTTNHAGVACVQFTGINTDQTAASTVGFVCADNQLYHNAQGGQGIIINGHGVSGGADDQVIITGNKITISNDPAWGILLGGVGNNSIIANNIIVGTGSATFAAIGVYSIATKSRVHHNIAVGWNAGAYGVFANSTVGGSLEYNAAYGCSSPLIGDIDATTMIIGNDTGTGNVAITNNGLSFGSLAVSSATDLSKHIALYSTTHGFSITPGRLNYVVPGAGNSHSFVVNGVDQLTIGSAGVSTGVNGFATAGNLNAGWSGAGGVFLNLNAAAGGWRAVVCQTAGSRRWYFGADTTAESGGNAGSNYALAAFDDSETLICFPIIITRATGAVKLANGIGVWGHAAPGAQPAAPVTLADVIAIIRGCGLSA